MSMVTASIGALPRSIWPTRSREADSSPCIQAVIPVVCIKSRIDVPVLAAALNQAQRIVAALAARSMLPHKVYEAVTKFGRKEDIFDHAGRPCAGKVDMVPPAGMEALLSCTLNVALRLCEIKCSTKISRGVGVLTVPRPSAVAVM